VAYCLGKRPARENAIPLKLKNYLDLSKLPTPPASFGHYGMVPDWKMLGNDRVGDCGIAGPMHAIMLHNAMAGRTVNVDTLSTLENYAAITGWDPNDPATDQGSDCGEVADYWQNTGLTDADGKVHQIVGSVALEPGNVNELYVAMYLLGAVGIGVTLPAQWQHTFGQGKWDVVAYPQIEGGHYILGTGSVNGDINVVTWGQNQLLTPEGYMEFNDETIAYLSVEVLNGLATIDGFDDATLRQDFAYLRGNV
jgi:hypothetical protein